MSSRPATPREVERKLRQEAGFGCANCGNPILDYHHIVEWHEKQHFDVEHMVALCPSCHREFSKLPKQKAYSVKANPINLRHGRLHGYLGGNKAYKGLKLGDTTIVNCNSVLNFCNHSLFSYKLVDGEFQLNAFLPDNNFWPEVSVQMSNLSAPIADFWDIEFKTNWVKFRKKENEIFFAVDFREEFVSINANLEILGEKMEFSKSGVKLANGGQISGGHIENCGVAIKIGPVGNLHPTNFALAKPMPQLFKS